MSKNTPKVYSFIKISNNNNATKDFYIHFTVQPNYKLAMSVLKSRYKLYKEKDIGNWHEIYEYFEKDYSYYCLEKQTFNNVNEAKEYTLDLYDQQYIKMNS